MTKTEALRVLGMGNHKLSKKIAEWSLPATHEVCGRQCPGCYAVKAQKIYPAVLPSRERKLKLARSISFIKTMRKALIKLQPNIVRIHSSGEFYSQMYVDKWEAVARAYPKTTFYAYTKRKEDFSFKKLLLLPNVVIIDSLKYGGLNYGPLDKKPEGAFLCPDYKGSELRKRVPKGPVCGVDCTYCMTKEAEKTGVYFVKH